MLKKLVPFLPVVLLILMWGYSIDVAAPAEISANSSIVKLRVTPSTENHIVLLKDLEAYRVSEIPVLFTHQPYEYLLPAEKVEFLDVSSIPYSLLPAETFNWDEDYYSYQEVYEHLLDVTFLYPDIAVMESLGVSTRDSVVIWGIKISDNAAVQENEPDVLFDAVTHAREPVNTNICIALIDTLVNSYGSDPDITFLVDETEIWIVPIKNPEGYLYVETGISNPWWRKTKRDNNNSGVFEGVVWEYCGNEYPSMPDGVDVNRNYAQGWNWAGSTDSCSILYRGPSAFSENESLMEKALIEREHPVASICFHSYSEYVGYCGQDPAGIELCQDIAASIEREDGGGSYDCFTFFGHGQSYFWMYREHGVQGYLIETGTEFFPHGEERIADIVENNMNGIFTLMNRVHGSGIRGDVTDADTGEPLEAEVKVVGEPVINNPRMSEPVHGRFTRLVPPGTYDLLVRKEGYFDMSVEDVVVEEGIPIDLDIRLVRTSNVPICVFPDTLPLIVPRGGEFGFTGTLINNSAQQIGIDTWTMAIGPEGYMYGPLKVFPDIELASGDTLSVHLLQHVAGGAPLGSYLYIAYCGDFPDAPYDSSCFTGEVVDTDAPLSADPGWLLEGEFREK